MWNTKAKVHFTDCLAKIFLGISGILAGIYVSEFVESIPIIAIIAVSSFVVFDGTTGFIAGIANYRQRKALQEILQEDRIEMERLTTATTKEVNPKKQVRMERDVWEKLVIKAAREVQLQLLTQNPKAFIRP